MKIVSFISSMSGVATILKKVVAGFTLFKAGIGIMVAGFVLMIASVIDLILNWDKFDNKQKIWRIGLALLGGAMITLGYAIATGISVATLGIGALIAIIAGVVSALVGLAIKFATEKEAILDVNDAQEKIK